MQRQQPEDAEGDFTKTTSTARRCEHFDDIPLGGKRRQETYRRAENAEAHVTKTAMTSSRREHFDGIPLGEARRKQT